MAIKLKALWIAAKEAWTGLPHQAQTAIVVVVSAGAQTLHKIATDPGTTCFTFLCIKRYIGAAVVAGVVAGRVFLMIPSNKAVPVYSDAKDKENPEGS